MNQTERCAAYWFGQRCRATKNLMTFIVSPIQGANAVYKLPEGLSVCLCKKHFAKIEPSVREGGGEG